MNKIKYVSLLIVLFMLLQSVICYAGDSNQKYTKVRLKDNGWIKILEQHKEEKFDERLGFKVWYLHVKILFLKYCKASLKKSRARELPPDASPNEKAEAIGKDMADFDTSIFYRFRCNYRTTVCLTLYSSDGSEYDTLKVIPQATKDRMEIFPGEIIWVTFVHTLFLDSKKPVSWQIWVPK